MRFAVRAAEEASLGLTPLIDVVLLLLIFFLVTTTFSERRLELELPSAENAEAVTGLEPFRIELAADGGVYWGGERGSVDGLRARLASAPPGPGGVELRADEGASHGRVVEILDLVRGEGVTRVGVVTTR